MKATQFIEKYGQYFGNTQEEVLALIKERLKEMGRNFEEIPQGGLVVAPISKHSRNPYIVAHMDVVHSWNISHDSYYELVPFREDTHLWSPTGLGADDRFGVVAALELLQNCSSVGALFTRDEEIGAIGASVMSSQLPLDFGQGVSFLVQIDRKGTDDAVFYNLSEEASNKESPSIFFMDFIEESMRESGHPVYTARGSFSDISVLAPALGVCAVNLSASYFNEHTDTETGDVQSLFSTIKALKTMLNSDEPEIHGEWPYVEKDYFSYKSPSQPTGGHSSWGDYGLTDYCEYCYMTLPADTTKNEQGLLLCKQCEEDWGALY